MKKDVIYIDIEDDITAVIEKLKSSKEKIIALVPPKGNAVLQSVVNLKLLKRAAESTDKQPVIVTNNQALKALSGGLGFYIAKNLQSKPALLNEEIVDEIDEDEPVEVSDEIGKLEETPEPQSGDDEDEMELSADDLSVLGDTDKETAEVTDVSKEDAKPSKRSKKDGKKLIPSFDDFRKKLLIGGVAALFLIIIGLLLFGRTKANIVLRAETTPVNVQLQAKLNAAASQSDPASYSLKAQLQETKKTLTQTFTPTGQRDVGQKAGGSVTVRNCDYSDGFTLAAGTQFTASNGKVFVSGQTVSVPKFTGPSFLCNLNGNSAGKASVSVTAASNGDSYNLGPQGYAISSIPAAAKVDAQGAQMSGGTTQVVQVVTQADVDKATDQLNQQDTNAIKSSLKSGFGKDVTVLEDSFTASNSNVTSSPAVGEQAANAKITADVDYTMLGATNSDLTASLDAFVQKQMTNKDQQRVYDDGFKSLKFTKSEVGGKTATYTLATVAQYGPQFDTDQLKKSITGKKVGEARSQLQSLPSVKGLDLKLTPFWASKLPNPGRIKIKLDVAQNTSA